MSDYSEGPWEKAEARTEGFVITSRKTLIVHSIDKYAHFGPIKSAADASLIAAAPDLLEALEGILRTMRKPPTGQNGYHEFDVLGAAKAIAKARGKS